MKLVTSEDLLKKLTNPFIYNQVVHGTYHDPLPLILAGGLNKMARNHVHLAVGYPGGGVISGMRSSCEVVIELNMTKAMYGAHKIPFYVSENKVILTEGIKDGSVPPQYFRCIYDFKKNKYIEQAPFDFICTFAFKYTNESNADKKIKEIELTLINLKSNELKHFYTNISTEEIDGDGVKIEEALKKVHSFLGNAGVFATEFVFMSCGDFDARALKKEAQDKDIQVPNYLKRWINIKKAFPMHLFDKEKSPPDFATPGDINKAKSTVVNIA